MRLREYILRNKAVQVTLKVKTHFYKNIENAG